MSAECNQSLFEFHPLKRRQIRAQFDGGAITSDGGGLLLREVEKRIGILRQFAACFTDYRKPELIEHSVQDHGSVNHLLLPTRIAIRVPRARTNRQAIRFVNHPESV